MSVHSVWSVVWLKTFDFFFAVEDILHYVANLMDNILMLVMFFPLQIRATEFEDFQFSISVLVDDVKNNNSSNNNNNNNNNNNSYWFKLFFFKPLLFVYAQ